MCDGSTPGPTQELTLLIRRAQSEGTDAREQLVNEIVRRYYPLLLSYARNQLKNQFRTRLDTEDVLQSMLKSFWAGLQRDRFVLNDRDGLLAVLITMTINKSRQRIRHLKAQRRNPNREQPAAELPDTDAAPEFAAAFNEVVDHCLRKLPENLQKVVLWKIEGYTHEEICSVTMLNCSERTVERKLKLIRDILQSEAETW